MQAATLLGGLVLSACVLQVAAVSEAAAQSVEGFATVNVHGQANGQPFGGAGGTQPWVKAGRHPPGPRVAPSIDNL